MAPVPPLAGQVALVTGASRGIGAAIARELAAAGATVVVNYASSPEAADAVVAEIQTAGGQAWTHQANVADEEQVEGMVKAVLEQEGRLDVLVNNAGIGHVGTMLTTTGVDLDRLYSVNVRGVFNVTKVFLPGMVERKSGSIVNIASIGAVVGVKDRLAYVTTKFAIAGMTKALALDHALDGVRANAICPGRVETPFVTGWLKKYPDPEKAYRDACATQAVNRMGKPEEIAAAALYLASDEAGFVTGTEFIIDGGFSAGK